MPQFTKLAYKSAAYPAWLQPIFRDILQARIYDLAIETPLDAMTSLSEKLGHNVYLKREDLQPVFSFKLRGAYNRIRQISPEARARGIVCASAGNHAQGVAMAAHKLGIRAVIVMPATTPEIKVASVRARGGEVVLHGDSFDQALVKALTYVEQGLEFIHPYDDEAVIAGQGTVGMEVLRQSPEDLHAIFIPVGGGGLASGIGSYVKYLQPNVRVIGVESVDSASMQLALEKGERAQLKSVGLFADGIAVKQAGELTYKICREILDDIITVTPDEMCAAIKDIFEATRCISEPSGAVAVAGMKKYLQTYKKTAGINAIPLPCVAISSGANMNFDRLRHIAERTAIGEQKEALLAVTIPEEIGSFRKLSEVLGQKNITEFNYRYSGSNKQASIFIGVQITDSDERAQVIELLSRNGYETVDLTDNEMAKVHLRHIVGGRASEMTNERVFRFIFPEKPSALRAFLDQLGQEWNISLFHYRNHGTDYGRVLVGFNVPPASAARFAAHIEALGYTCEEETENPAYTHFLR
jgi:threonine dehydratase